MLRSPMHLGRGNHGQKPMQFHKPYEYEILTGLQTRVGLLQEHKGQQRLGMKVTMVCPTHYLHRLENWYLRRIDHPIS